MYVLYASDFWHRAQSVVRVYFELSYICNDISHGIPLKRGSRASMSRDPPPYRDLAEIRCASLFDFSKIMNGFLFTRTRPGYLISSDTNLLSLPAITAAFASPALYWCKPLPTASLQACLSNSFNLGLYADHTSPDDGASLPHSPQFQQIGLARLITDQVTFAWLTDVYVVEEEKGKGLGKWLVQCVDEVLSQMSHLRRAMLITGEGGPEGFYERELGMKRFGRLEGRAIIMQRVGDGVGLSDQE